MSSSHRVIALRTPTEQYDIHVGQGAAEQLGEQLTECLPGPRKVFLFSHPSLITLYGSDLTATLRGAGYEVETCEIPEGETSKTLESAARLFTHLAEAGADRQSVICALGGGVIGDLSGFVAATYMRGIPFAQIPTSLLAMVDSSVGGKTGVNHTLGKNLIGAFYPPQAVCTDIAFLRSLPEREYLCGLSEIVKAGVIEDAELFAFIENQVEAIGQRDEAVLTTLIERAIAVKVRVVQEDPTEKGIRAILNFGHTIGHALEAATAYETYSHGEAVAIGMALVARLSETLGYCTPDVVERLYKVLNDLGLPVSYSEIDPAYIIELLSHDKKTVGGIPRFILLKDIGSVVHRQEVPVEVLQELLVQYA